MYKIKNTFFILIFIASSIFAQDAKEIIRASREKIMGKYSSGVNKMTIVRPDWTREIEMKFWSSGTKYYLLTITKPARDKGQVFLKRETEMWNFIPAINRLIKIPPSMMMQSWMGSDFTNDDLVKESSIENDYTHNIIGKERINDFDCHKIELIPNEDAPVVWGKVIMWVSVKEYYQLKIEFYDEDNFLINTQYSENIKKIGGRTIPTKLTMVPADKERQKTIFETLEIEFDKSINNSFFSQQNMKRIR